MEIPAIILLLNLVFMLICCAAVVVAGMLTALQALITFLFAGVGVDNDDDY